MHVLQGEETGRLMAFIQPNDWAAGVREAHEVDFTKFDKIPMEFFVHKRTEVQPYDKLLDMIEDIPAPVKLRIFDNEVPQSVKDRTRFGNFPFNQWIKGTNTDRHYAN